MNTNLPNGEEVIAVSLESLATHILTSAPREGAEVNPYNWMMAAKQRYGDVKTPAMRAWAEAWQWIISKGFVARDYGQPSSNWMFVTRAGADFIGGRRTG